MTTAYLLDYWFSAHHRQKLIKWTPDLTLAVARSIQPRASISEEPQAEAVGQSGANAAGRNVDPAGQPDFLAVVYCLALGGCPHLLAATLQTVLRHYGTAMAQA